MMETKTDAKQKKTVPPSRERAGVFIDFFSSLSQLYEHIVLSTNTLYRLSWRTDRAIIQRIET